MPHLLQRPGCNHFPQLAGDPAPGRASVGGDKVGLLGPSQQQQQEEEPRPPGEACLHFPRPPWALIIPETPPLSPALPPPAVWEPRAGLSLVVFRKSGSCALNNLNLMRKRGVDQEEEEAAAREHRGFPRNRAVRAHAQASIITLSSQAAPGEVSSSRGALEGAPPTPGGHWELLRGGSEGHLPPPNPPPPRLPLCGK